MNYNFVSSGYKNHGYDKENIVLSFLWYELILQNFQIWFVDFFGYRPSTFKITEIILLAWFHCGYD